MMEWSAAPPHHDFDIDRRAFLNQSDDPRIGSTRDNSTSGTASTLAKTATQSGTNSASLTSLGSTFVPVIIYSAICLAIFFTFRRKCPRVYAPRTLQTLRGPEHPSPRLPNGWVNWIKPFFAIKDDYILNHCTLDGFFFLRFLRIISIICLAGACLAWPILLPIHGTGGFGLQELDLLTIGNIKLSDRFYAHVAVAWCFFGFVLFTVCRECIYYINLRQAYLLSPNYSKRLSSRTVLFTCIPRPYLEEAKLRKLFGDSAKNIWIPRNTSRLRGLVDDRKSTADRLQKAEVQLIRMANAARNKHLKKHPEALPPHLPGSNASGSKTPGSRISTQDSSHGDEEKGKADSAVRFAERQLSALDAISLETQADPEYTHPYGLEPSLPDVRGSVASLWIPAEARPHHRPIANFGRRVDTIRWSRARLKALNRDIWKLRRKHRGGDGAPLDAAFIEFESQASAQVAFQTLAHHQPLHMSPRYIGIQPQEIIWSAFRIKWWELIMRRFFMMSAITAAIIFWSIPSALVGTISNIHKLSQMVFFLNWIELLPTTITGVIEGLLPALALSLLMAAVPVMLRGCARVAGVPSHALVELYVQGGYFAFQVVQVFIVTTLTSAASSAFEDILKDPLSVKDLLSQNLPKASNFYLSYILVQCLAAGANNLCNVVDLFRHEVLGKSTINPRRQFERWRKLRPVHWGSEYPRITNMGVIAISYSCIAPLILVFGGLGMEFLRIVYRYNLIYVFDSDFDTKGLFYPRALLQLLIGLYVAEICLIGLFALKIAIGPMLLMILFLVFTGLVHMSLSDSLTPLLNNLPRTLAMEKDHGPIEDPIPAAQTPSSQPRPEHSGGLAANYYDEDEHFGDEPEPPPLETMDTDTQMRGIEGSSSIKYAVAEWTKSAIKARFKPDNDDQSGLTRVLAQIKAWITPDPARKPNFIMLWLHPETYQDFRALQATVNPGPDDVELPPDYVRRVYQPPEMWRPAPRLWLPKDGARVSRQELAHSKDAIVASDQGCWLNDKGRVVCDHEASPLHEPVILY
ncbi:hypothetical protein B0T26DRAFT_299036 [Lasiosphaeria miniovina]|uniref:Uncharacterized protein n=1 Tax=Lasiosphaeria miniovina TaxID=1954250 RepID=A0AA40AKI3_9PEZI|nr:uncharacterized protein B0T26DRAFT_299036 [Lasiosphaeria miniovina]KAK0717541.1 hypothetical protein B0T26DRAFT_299036 [Lasiosphaeria miniovina]